MVRLVRDDPDGLAAEAREADDDVLRVVGVDLEELAVVHDAPDEADHVVRLVRRGGHDAVELGILAVDGVAVLAPRRVLLVVRRQEAEERADLVEAVRVRVRDDVRDARDGGVRVGAAERLLRDVLVRDRLDDVGPVTNIELVPRTMRTKSVIAGE